MNKTFKYIIVLAAVIIGSTSAWARGGGRVVNTNVTGGELTLSYQKGTNDPVAVTAGVTDVPAGAIVTIVAGPNLGYTLKDFDITAQSTTGSGNAEARSFTRSNGPGIGQTIAVSPMENVPGIYTFTMPDGVNVLISATFKGKPYLGDGTNAHISYYSYDAQGNRVTLNTGNDGHPRVYILDGTETELGQSGETVWYVSTTQTYNRSLTVLGTVGLILRDGTTMTVSHGSNATASISGDADASLTTYGQSAGTGRLAVSNAEGTAISVGAFSILGTGVAISNSTQGISTAVNGTLHIAVLPTFGSGTANNGCDIFLSAGTVIDMVANITAAPQQRITVGFGEGYTAPFSFTNGYGAHCHYATGTKAGEVIAVGEMFASSTLLEEYQAIVYGNGREYSSSDTYVPGEASLINDTESTTPSVVATVTNTKGTVEYFFGDLHPDAAAPHFRGAVLAANAATSDVELKLCSHVDFGDDEGVTFNNTHQVTDGAVTRPVAITLNLDVFTISGKNNFVLSIEEGTSLTIINTGNPGGLPTEDGVSSTQAGILADDDADAINNLGTLTIKGGRFKNTNGSIYNRGTVYVKGGLIYSHIQNEYDGIVYFSGGAINAKDVGIRNSSYEGSPHVYISGGLVSGYIYGIQNTGGAVTISGGTIAAGYKSGNISGTAIYSDGSLTFEALPTINVEGTGSKDIYLGKDGIITFGSNFAVGSTFDKLKVCINEANGLDYTFTNGYSARVKYATGTDKAGQVIPPAEFFDAYYDNNNVALSSALRLTDGGEAELFEPLYSYIDATGTLHENVQAIVLNGSETSIGLSRTVSGSSEPIMYICTTPASENNGQGLVYENNLVLNENVPLIIADGCKLTVPGINGSGKTLSIFGQSGATGQVNVTEKGIDIGSSPLVLANVDVSSVGKSDDYHYGLVASTIDIVSTTDKTNSLYVEADYSAISASGNVSISGVSLSLNPAEGDQISAGSHTITLGWTHTDDNFNIGSYSGTLAIAEGQYFQNVDGNSRTIFSGTPAHDDIVSKGLTPAIPIDADCITLSSDPIVYNGQVQLPDVTVTYGGKALTASTDYAIGYEGAVDASTSNLVTVTPKGLYFGIDGTTIVTELSKTFTISPKPVGISWSTDALIYDGTDKAPAASATDVEDRDAGKVSVTVTVDGDHSDAGNYTATASALSGGSASNYKLPESGDAGFATLTKAFAISPKPVTVSGSDVTAESKTYDGTTDATVSGTFAFDAGMIIGSDVVSISGATGTFADKNVGTGKTVTISGITLSGDDAGNYVLDTENQTPIIATADIAAKTVTVTSGITASNKTYDGTTSATLSGSSAVISGKVTSDKLTVSATGKFVDKNAGTGKTVTISSISLTGSDRGNYVLATTGNQATATASITKKSLTVTADDKSVEYGDAAPTYTASYSGFVSRESKSNLSGSLSFSCSYTSSSKTGTYTITPSGHTSSNYSISYAAGTLTVGAKDVAYSGGTVTQDENGYTVTLDEGTGSANTLPDDADLYSLTYSRTLTPPGSGEGEATIGGQAANLYTVCLPFSPETGTDIKYYTLSGVSGETVSFEEVTTPAANTPYLIAVTGSTNIAENCTGMVVTSMEINSTTKDGYTFTGTFTGLKHAQAVGKHILQSHNKWRVVEENGSVFIPPFRAYIESTNGARMLTGCLDDEATGIDSLRLQDADGTEQWYDLNGRRISKPTRKGIYIHNGKVTTKR